MPGPEPCRPDGCDWEMENQTVASVMHKRGQVRMPCTSASRLGANEEQGCLQPRATHSLVLASALAIPAMFWLAQIPMRGAHARERGAAPPPDWASSHCGNIGEFLHLARREQIVPT